MNRKCATCFIRFGIRRTHFLLVCVRCGVSAAASDVASQSDSSSSFIYGNSPSPSRKSHATRMACQQFSGANLTPFGNDCKAIWHNQWLRYIKEIYFIDADNGRHIILKQKSCNPLEEYWYFLELVSFLCSARIGNTKFKCEWECAVLWRIIPNSWMK